jgi:hypothetical protein
MNRASVERALGSLKSRVFLFHDIHEGPPVFFHTRWAMSYLRGPMTRKQIRQLAADLPQPDLPVKEQEQAKAEEKPIEPSAAAPAAKRTPKPAPSGLSAAPPTLPTEVPQVFLPPTITFEWALREHEEQAGGSILARERQMVYMPYLLALGTVRTIDQKRGVNHQQVVARLVQPSEGPLGVDWSEGQAVVSREDLAQRPMGEGVYGPVPSSLTRAKGLQQLEKEYSDYLYYNIATPILYNPALDLYGKVGESRRDFRVRCEKEAREERDAELKKARAKIEQQVDRIEQRIRREQRELDGDLDELEARKREEMLGLGESALNLVLGKRTRTAISRASRRRTYTRKAQADVEESEEAIVDFKGQLEDLKDQWEEQAAEINDAWAEKLEQLEEFLVKPRRADVMVEYVGVAWTPAWQVMLEDGQQIDLPARKQSA